MTGVDLPLDRRAVLMNGVGVIFLASILFGVMAVFVRVAVLSMPSSQVAFVRFSGSLLVLLALGRGRALRPQPGNLFRVVLRGLLGGGAIILYYRGIQGAGAGLATLLNCTYPVFTALFATTLMGERFDTRVGASLVLSMVGVVIVLNPSADLSSAATWGGMSALGAAVFAGGAVATARQLRSSESAMLITTYFMAVGATLTAPTLLMGLPALSYGLLVALAGVVLTSVVGQVLLHQGLGFAPATQGSLAAATSVVTAAGLEAVWLGDHLSSNSLLGAAFMIGAVALAASRR
jgi:drug/metabolite transporter (DMT)-like permease